MTKQTLYHSSVLFRTSPEEEVANMQHLGFVIGLNFGAHLVFATLMRKSINHTFLSSLDALSKEIVENRSKIIDSEINAVWHKSETPQAVLKEISARNTWALYVDRPHRVTVTLEPQTERSAPPDFRRLTYAIAVWHREISSAKRTADAERVHSCRPIT
jgi:hypothetical protein